MSPHPARIFVFVALLLAWLLTARAALATEPSESPAPFDELPRESLEDLPREILVAEDALMDLPLVGPSFGSRGTSATFSIGAFAGQRSDGYRERGGLVVIGIPFERIAAPRQDPRLVSRSSALLDPHEGEDRDDDEEHDNPEILVLRERPETSKGLLSRPFARICVEKALRAAGLFDDERLDSLASRARASAALPDLRLRATRATDASLRLSPTQYDPYRYTEGEAAGHRLEATMSFRLDRLLFADQEVSLERIRLQRHKERLQLTSRILRALFDWQRARALEQDPTLSPEEQLTAQLRVLEAEATLEVLAGGGCIADNRM